MIISGALVELKKAKKETLENILRKHAEHELTGYILYKGKDIFLVIGLVEGRVASCRAIKFISSKRVFIHVKTRSKVIDGADCCGEAIRYLNERKGTIAVYETSYDIILLNIINTPMTRVENTIGFTELLRLKVGLTPQVSTPTLKSPKIETLLTREIPTVQIKTAKPEPAPSVQQPQQPFALPLPREELSQPKVSSEIITTIPTTPVEKQPGRPSSKISSECIDPATLFTIMKTSQLEDTLTDIDINELINKMIELASSRNIKTLYARGSFEDSTARVLYDHTKNTVYIEVDEADTSKCGESALSRLTGKRAKYINIMSSK